MNDDFRELIESLNLSYFKPYEFWVKGPGHDNTGSRAYGLNTDPPRDLWKNIIPTARVIDEFRRRIGSPIIITNAYRSPAYNEAVGGARNSLHVQFKALDFVVK